MKLFFKGRLSKQNNKQTKMLNESVDDDDENESEDIHSNSDINSDIMSEHELFQSLVKILTKSVKQFYDDDDDQKKKKRNGNYNNREKQASISRDEVNHEIEQICNRSKMIEQFPIWYSEKFLPTVRFYESQNVHKKSLELALHYQTMGNAFVEMQQQRQQLQLQPQSTKYKHYTQLRQKAFHFLNKVGLFYNVYI